MLKKKNKKRVFMNKLLTIEGKYEILEGAKKAFFAAMVNGYAGGKDMNGVPFEVGDYVVIDKWWKTGIPGHSMGTTIIYYKHGLRMLPVWNMSYEGSYPKEVIPFLLEALSQTYQAGIFLGGRGPTHYHNTVYAYNNIIDKGDFSCFSGVEAIQPLQVAGGRTLGAHRYWGTSLI
jgi:hypothetical protein